MVRPLLVVVVQAVELRNEEPAGKRADEEQIFGGRVEPRMRTALAEHELGKEEGQGEPDQVGDHERPAHEPPAPVTARAPALEDLERLPVGDPREVFRKRCLGRRRVHAVTRLMRLPMTRFRMASGVEPSTSATVQDSPWNRRTVPSATETCTKSPPSADTYGAALSAARSSSTMTASGRSQRRTPAVSPPWVGRLRTSAMPSNAPVSASATSGTRQRTAMTGRVTPVVGPSVTPPPQQRPRHPTQFGKRPRRRSAN